VLPASNIINMNSTQTEVKSVIKMIMREREALLQEAIIKGAA
jgi:hypothetical protein